MNWNSHGASRGQASAVLVTGAHRSGTTWVGRVLAQPRRHAYIHEPFNIYSTWAGARPLPCRYWYTYVTSDNAVHFREPIADILAHKYPVSHAIQDVTSLGTIPRVTKLYGIQATKRLFGFVPVMKDPLALFSAPWLADTFSMNVVVMVRHPAAFAASLKRAQWEFPFADLRNQPLLMRDYLQPFAQELEQAIESPPSIVRQAALLWKLLYSAVVQYHERYPNSWYFVRHKDISERPQHYFREIFAHIGAPYTTAIQREVMEYSQAVHQSQYTRFELKRDSVRNLGSWRSELDNNDLLSIRRIVEPISSHFYEAHEW